MIVLLRYHQMTTTQLAISFKCIALYEFVSKAGYTVESRYKIPPGDRPNRILYRGAYYSERILY